ncbi:hypothetical protein AB5J62_24605 [Amycolatopsis sp. cg5]|uniref:hypothetical protein n=1 Tax=Amycolatopsis sp. cg5 TaxID=3238802 RepID=UPI003523BB6A
MAAHGQAADYVLWEESPENGVRTAAVIRLPHPVPMDFGWLEPAITVMNVEHSITTGDDWHHHAGSDVRLRLARPGWTAMEAEDWLSTTTSDPDTPAAPVTAVLFENHCTVLVRTTQCDFLRIDAIQDSKDHTSWPEWSCGLLPSVLLACCVPPCPDDRASDKVIEEVPRQVLVRTFGNLQPRVRFRLHATAR